MSPVKTFAFTDGGRKLLLGRTQQKTLRGAGIWSSVERSFAVEPDEVRALYVKVEDVARVRTLIYA